MLLYTESKKMMATLPVKQASSGSEQDDRYAMIDEKKRKRMISNRDSARRSRMKREQHMKDLNDQVMYFETKKNEMIRKFNEVTKKYRAIEAENMIMRSQKQELSKRLECAETLSSYVGETSDEPVGAHQDPWLSLQQYPMPIMSSAGFFEF